MDAPDAAGRRAPSLWVLGCGTAIPQDARFWYSVLDAARMPGPPARVEAPAVALGGGLAALRTIVAAVRSARAGHAGERLIVLLPFCGQAIAERLREVYRGAFWLLGASPSNVANDPAPQECDFVVDAVSTAAQAGAIGRFLSLLDGRQVITPTRSEQGMFFAACSALRSAALRGQVGAALCDEHGELIVTGTNEVSCAGGGLYWADAEPDGRDFARFGYDFATAERAKDLDGVLRWLLDAGLLGESEFSAATELADSDDPNRPRPAILHGVARGRVVHAEEAALLGAARRGVSVAGAEAFLTHSPCHLCLRHLIAAGVRRIVFLRPDDQTELLQRHGDSISVGPGNQSADLVGVLPFVGVSPRGYSRLFARPRPRRAPAEVDAFDWTDVLETAIVDQVVR